LKRNYESNGWQVVGLKALTILIFGAAETAIGYWALHPLVRLEIYFVVGLVLGFITSFGATPLYYRLTFQSALVCILLSAVGNTVLWSVVFQHVGLKPFHVLLHSVSTPLLLWLTCLAWYMVARNRETGRPPTCPECGYDLRGGSLESGCPECGWNRPAQHHGS